MNQGNEPTGHHRPCLNEAGRRCVTFSVFAACEALSSTLRPVSCPAISRTADRNAALFVWNWSEDTVTAPKVNRSKTTPLQAHRHSCQSAGHRSSRSSSSIGCGCCGTSGDAHIAK